MNNKEAKAMEGTEFTYIFSDGDEIRAYVKKYDPAIGLTCLTLDTETRDGWTDTDARTLEPDGTFCVIGCPAEDSETKEWIKEALKQIKEGSYKVSHVGGNFEGCPF